MHFSHHGVVALLALVTLTAHGAITSQEEHGIASSNAITEKQERRNQFFRRMGCPMEGFVKGESRKDGTILTVFTRSHQIDVAGKKFQIEEPGLHEFFVPVDKKGNFPSDGKGVRLLRAPAPGEDPCHEYRDIEP